MPFQPNLLVALRDAKGLSQQQLAVRAGVSQSVIAKSERGSNSPGSEVLEKFAKALDCTTDYLLGRGPDYQDPMEAAVQMAFEVAQPSLTDEQRERCRRVLRHPNAPKTSEAWRGFAELVDIAAGTTNVTSSLALVKRPPKRTGASGRHRNDSRG